MLIEFMEPVNVFWPEIRKLFWKHVMILVLEIRIKPWKSQQKQAILVPILWFILWTNDSSFIRIHGTYSRFARGGAKKLKSKLVSQKCIVILIQKGKRDPKIDKNRIQKSRRPKDEVQYYVLYQISPQTFPPTHNVFVFEKYGILVL